MRAETTFSISGIGKITVSVPESKKFALQRVSGKQIEDAVRKSASGLTSLIRTNAPYRTGALQRGIITSPFAERSAVPGKVVYDVYFDAKMNDTFVKMTKSGKRYYYPASQEYGFRIGRTRRKPGLYYMRNTSVEYFGTHEAAVAAAVDEILEDL